MSYFTLEKIEQYRQILQENPQSLRALTDYLTAIEQTSDHVNLELLVQLAMEERACRDFLVGKTIREIDPAVSGRFLERSLKCLITESDIEDWKEYTSKFHRLPFGPTEEEIRASPEREFLTDILELTLRICNNFRKGQLLF